MVTIERPLSELRYKSRDIALEIINRLNLRVEQCNRNAPYYFDRASKYLESALYEGQITDKEYEENRRKITNAINGFSDRCRCINA